MTGDEGASRGADFTVSEQPTGWGLPDAAAGFVAGMVGGVVFTSVWAAVQGSTRTTLGMIVSGLAGLWSGYLTTMLLVSRFKGTGRLDRDLRLGLGGLKGLLAGILTGAGSGLFLVPLLYLLLLSAGVIDQETLDQLSDPAERLLDTAPGSTFLLLALLVGVGAPLVEECFFRGFVQPAAVRRFGSVAGVVGTAAVFAAAHFQMLQFPALFLFGLLLGLLAHRSGRIGPCVVAHIVFNGLTLVRLALLR
ncbi:MAG: CPBP family intramembrane metalloprotease [Actinomycetota bacterium]|nr:CPBP family intramembrane metalloprotease [Actinomycetota bacterium]